MLYNHKLSIVFVLTLSFFLVGCDSTFAQDQISTATPFPTLAPTPVPDTSEPTDSGLPDYNLEPGTYRASVSGAFEGNTDLTTNTMDASYTTTDTRGTSENLPSTNYTGNTEINLPLQVTTADNDTARLTITLTLSEALTSGEYTPQRTVPSFNSSAVLVSGYGPTLGNFRLDEDSIESSTVTIDFINRGYIIGSAQGTLSDDDGNAFTFDVAFNQIPYISNEAECLTRVSGALTLPERIMRMGKNVTSDMWLAKCGISYIAPSSESATAQIIEVRGGRAEFNLPRNIEPGEYDISPNAEPISVTISDIRLTENAIQQDSSRILTETFSAQNISGTITIYDEGDDTIGEFNLTYTIDRGEVTMEGEMRIPGFR